MNSGILSPGEKIKISTEVDGRVEKLLGAGGQGEVYLVDVQGAPYALKWYYPESATDSQREILKVLIDKGSPDPRYLWPVELVTDPAKSDFGYLMAVREPRYKGVSDLLTRRVNPSLRSIITACINLPDSFLQLHAEGLCYRDISQGNVFFDPNTGEILICDNDNVGVDGGQTSILGTPRFMAPEVVRHEAMPSTQTDLFSLAVLLFLMLINHHPLDGRKEAEIHCFDLKAMIQLYGESPVFIFDPADDSNRPVPGTHPNPLIFWPIYPKFVRDLFVRSFTDGLTDPVHGRIRETAWRTAMRKLRDSIFYCTCGAENFYDPDALRASGGVMPNCWKCRRQLVLPPRIRIGKKTTVMLNSEAKLFGYHLTESQAAATITFAEVSRHPTDPDRVGLKNLTMQSWTATLKDGSVRVVPPGKSLALAADTHIQFGETEGQVRL